ncbi:MAG: PHP domain-containing protein [Nitrospirae bacterium YQR-1]
MKFDCHVHTSPKSSCSIMSPERLLKAAAETGIEAVVLTEHDYLWSAGELNVLRAKCDGALRIFAGAEVSCIEGHFLVFGLHDLKGISYNMQAEKLIAFAHERGAAVVAAHPYRFNWKEGQYCYELDIDGVEILSSNTTKETGRLAEKLANDRGLFQLTSSDAHTDAVIGKYYTIFPEDIATVEELAEFIRCFKR